MNLILMTLTVLNSLHPCLTFTLEKGNKSMPFLDVNVSIDSRSFITTVYRKETHTGVFLNFHAVAPTLWKRGVIMCLLYRAKMICSSVSLFNVEISALKNMFFRNSYSYNIFILFIMLFCVFLMLLIAFLMLFSTAPYFGK